jgi:hypothetical protein
MPRIKWKTRKQNGGIRNHVTEYKNSLTNYAFSDAKHDFSDVSGIKFYSQYKGHIKLGIPKFSNYIEYSENKLLETIQLINNDTPNNNNNNNNKPMKFTIDNLLNNHNNMNILDVIISNKIHKKYNINIVLFKRNKKLKVDPKNLDYIFGGKRTFIVDTFNMNIFNGFKKGNNYNDIDSDEDNNEETDNNDDNNDDNNKSDNNIELYNENDPYYILYNREMENDPGIKAKLKEKHFEKRGHCIKISHDIDTKTISYVPWSLNNIKYTSMLFSKYTFMLMYINNKLNLHINTISGEFKDENPKINNTPKNLINLVNHNQLTPELAFQKKRCGDCLQALSIFDNKRKLSDMNAHKNPKMLITHDRMLLYYGLLLGIDVGYTAIRYNNKSKYYYLISFVNQASNSIHDLNNSNNANTYKGGRKVNNINNKTIKLNNKNNKNDKTRYQNNMPSKIINKENEYVNSESEFNEIILPEIKKFAYPFSNNTYSSQSINSFKNFISSNKNKNNFIKYIEFINNVEYDKDFISKLMYMKYITNCAFSLDDIHYDNSYYDEIYSITGKYNYLYKESDIDTKINDVIQYYKINDNSFADYIKSINCLIWIINKYKDIIENVGFNTCEYTKLKELLTSELKAKLQQEDLENTSISGSLNGNEDDELTWYGEIILLNRNKYYDIYRKSFYTEDWDFIDFNNIITYIYKHDLDAFSVLTRLASDYSWAMRKVKKVEPGIQSVSIMVFDDLDYEYPEKVKRTPDIQTMVDEINNIRSELYLEDFSESYNILTNLFKRTVEKQLTWGAKIF